MSLPTSEQVAAEIRTTVDGLLTSRKDGRFTDSDKDWGAGGRTGAASSLQGLRSVFGALAALPDDRELWAIVKPFHASLLKEWQSTLGELTETNYGPDPYDDEKRSFDKLRREADGTVAPYVDTVAWALSTSVIVNYVIPFAEKSWGVKLDNALVEQTQEEIARSARTLVDLQLDNGGWGWGRAADLNTAHMYFTWTAIQGFADLFDYVLGDSQDEIGIARDHSTIARLQARDATLEKDASAARDEAAQYLRDAYLTVALSSNGLTYPDLESRTGAGQPARASVIDPGSDIPLLYFYSYLLEALILSSYDKNNAVIVASRRSELDRLYVEVKRRFAQIRPKASTGDLDITKATAQIAISGEEKRTGRTTMVNKYVARDPGLWPQILRTLVLYPYYVERPRFPDEDIVGPSGVYTLLLNDRRPRDREDAPSLWDKFEFNLAISSRSLEGLIDVYDYVRLLADRAREAEAIAPAPPLAELLADALYPHVRIRLQADTEMTAAAPTSEKSGSEMYVRGIALDAAESKLSEKAAEASHILIQRLVTMDSKAVKGLVDEVIGKDHDVFGRENPAAYQFVKAIVVASIATVSRLLSQILQEAVFAIATETESQENERSYKGDSALYKRIRLALKEVMRHEISTESWAVDSVIRQVLLMTSNPAPPTPPRGRKANP